MRELVIGGRRIADDEPAYLVAELGQNHQGQVKIAEKLIQAAAACGASAVKLQKRDNKNLYSAALYNQPYDNENSFGPTYGTHREALEFDREAFEHVQGAAFLSNVAFFATAFDEASADFLMDLKVPAIKIASGGLTDLALLSYVAILGVPMIVSTGGGTYADVDRAANIIAKMHTQFALLHCTASYPCAWEELNLACVAKMRERYPETVIGWSGHDSGIAMALVAYVQGARIIEKHFTLNRAMKGGDHAFSLEPAGLRKLARDLERARIATGNGEKQYYASEVGPIAKMRRRQTEHGMQITGARDVLAS